ncbi:MAG: L,D-transpeptidase family protein [Alphaproteobacteria bacterium]|nr:L,D-transpeptidase family protein [Alphaproteobacteria bacterium]
MNLVLKKRSHLWWGETLLPCTWGRGGIREDKKEGDGATPIGTFPFRKVFYRADRLITPKTCLPLSPLSSQDGWCDDVADPAYNKHIQKPYKGRHEDLWRTDHVYDMILVVGHNDDPVVKGGGSAIFVHLRRPKSTPTDGCVALDLPDLLKILTEATPESCLIVEN